MSIGFRQNLGLILILAFFALAFLSVRPAKKSESDVTKRSE